jgi:glyoxylase-like metal-dependent hydrolase (beta-lactamase superfamily II)
MPEFLCKACGVQYPDSVVPPEKCIICEDERQFVPKTGQQWVTPKELASGHFNAFRKMAPGLFAIWTTPQFAIGQRAFLTITPEGNVLWDCVSLLDAATIEIVRALGGIKAIALSHPHFYSAMASWGRMFDCPVLVHEADQNWVVAPDPCVKFWQGDVMEVMSGVSLHRLGGHFPGSTVLHLADCRTVLSGDTVLVTWDRRHVAFMWSYPNYVPLPAQEVERIGQRLHTLDFDALYSAFWDRGDIEQGAKAAVARSVERHVEKGQPENRGSLID